jgi:hypothetical protein
MTAALSQCPSTVSERLERQGVLTLEASIPEGMTIDEWRRRRTRDARRRPHRGRSRRSTADRHLAALPEATCDHLHDTTSRYDRSAKVLTFLLVCYVCGTERVVERLPYEPRFEQHPSRLAA